MINTNDSFVSADTEKNKGSPSTQPHWFFKYLPVILLIIFAIIIYSLLATKPDADRRKPPASNKISVETKVLSAQDIPVNIRSFGLVAPRIESKIVAQVSGQIIFISNALRDGGFFQKNDILATIEKADYQAAVDIAMANVAASEQMYLEEQAQAQQAEEDWHRLGNQGTPSELTLRKPQLKSAQTGVASAKAQLRQAKLNLSRTDIRAPFDGRVRSKSVDIGQVVATNTLLADIFAIDAIEIKLPIKNSELKLLDLTDSQFDNKKSSVNSTRAIIKSTLIEEELWEAEIVRVAGAIDDDSRQLNLTAQIMKPYSPQYANKTPLKIGEYVTAQIQGRTVRNTISIPNKAIYQGTYVYLYKDGKAFRKDINIFWQNESEAIIKQGLKPGDELITTPLGQISSGTAVAKEGDLAQAHQNRQVSSQNKKENKDKSGQTTSNYANKGNNKKPAEKK